MFPGYHPYLVSKQYYVPWLSPQYVEAYAGDGTSALAVTSGTANVMVTAPGATSSNQALPVANGEAHWRAEVRPYVIVTVTLCNSGCNPM